MNILYLGNFSFPYGNASGARVIGNGYALKDLGHEVQFIGLDKKAAQVKELEYTKFTYEDFVCYNLPTPKGIKDWLRYNETFNILTNFFEKQKPDVIILYGSVTLSLINEKIRKWCIKHKVKFYVDCVDMIPVKSGSLLFKIIKSFDEYYQKKMVNFRADGVIAISNYISYFYKNKVGKTVVIPPLVTPTRFFGKNDICFNSHEINLIYVGNPFPTDGRKIDKEAFKDRLDLAIEILSELDNPKFIFRIYGLKKENYLNVLPEHNIILDKMKERVLFEGPIDNARAISAIKASDFTILLRDVNIMSTAGFPTKFVESIACGTPVITNNTSDLSNYLINGENGFMLKSLEKSYLKEQFNNILGLSRNQIEEKKDLTVKYNPFLYQNFKDQFKFFLDHE